MCTVLLPPGDNPTADKKIYQLLILKRGICLANFPEKIFEYKLFMKIRPLEGEVLH